VILEEQKDEKLFVATYFIVTNTSNDSWLIDNGCINHMTHNEKLFRELNKIIIFKVKIGDGDFISVKGKYIIVIESLLGLKYTFDF